MARNPPQLPGIQKEKFFMAMSYKVLKAQPKTLNKANVTGAWGERVTNHSSSPSPAVLPPMSLFVKKMVETGLVFEPRNIKM